MRWIAVLALALTACVTPVASPQDQFFARLSALCGQAFAGRLVSEDPRDADFASQPLVMHVRECSDDTVRIPLSVGENRSRTWVITRTDAGLRLKHDHRYEDGGEDALSQYGGDTIAEGSAARQAFPADAFSRQLFTERNIPASVANVWAMEIEPRRLFAYELRRPDRYFRVEFDLTRPIAAPPPPWGAKVNSF
ncbi:MAG: hypothetical protein K2P58_15335 [Hyphomonadaceae bacterium]|nr:hypothetical protein [Hyphomonadaceae bacterium]